MKKKRLMAMVMAAVMAVPALSGCGSSETAETTAAAAAETTAAAAKEDTAAEAETTAAESEAAGETIDVKSLPAG